ncbi:hypothetical protein OHC33_010004 [Knufia fluminis]|uniref:Uncharacterized protein n=1 Tax=Knufia fluminis TaxID=191047 RepID=A0AAN8E9C2_9EURO|nr:hypothetical protein OHC33_010004 [Knufia fluminis]
MPAREVITAADGLKSPLLSQAIKYGDTIYLSGSVGMDFTTMKLIEGSVADRTKKALQNLEIVLKEAGSSLNNLLKVRALTNAERRYGFDVPASAHALRTGDNATIMSSRSNSTRALPKASKTKNNKRTRASERLSKNRRRSSTRFPQPYVEDADSELDGMTIDGSPASTSYSNLAQRASSDAYQADTEGASRPRRFSDLYGHGHRFEESGEKFSSPTLRRRSLLNHNKKRRSSEDSEDISPKKVRFNPADDETKIFEKGSVPSPTWPPPPVRDDRQTVAEVDCDDTLSDLDEELIEPMRLPENPDEYLLNLLRKRPMPLSLSQISGLFHVVQGLTEDFARTWFGPTGNEDMRAVVKDMLAFPIHDLELKNPALFFTAINVLDASTTHGVADGWRRCFAHPDYRQYFVYAVLGEWFTQRIFKDTSFGLSDLAQDEMHEEVDKAFLHFESFIRAKKRGEVLDAYMGPEGADSAEETAQFLKRQAAELADEILTVLEPMLPWNRVAGQQAGSREEVGEMQEFAMKVALVELISQCVALNWSIVRSGENGTIIRIADRIENGKRYWPTAPMHCINQDIFDKTRDQSAQNAVPVVKMTCWGRVEAYVPQGPDMKEMAKAEKQHVRDAVKRLKVEGKKINKKALDKIHANFCWKCTDAELWPVLPQELWPIEHANRQKTKNRIRNAEWRQKLERRRARTSRPDDNGSDPDDSGSGPDDNGSDPDDNSMSSSQSTSSESSNSSSSSTTDTDTDTDSDLQNGEHELGNGERDDNEPLRGSWVTYFSCLNPHQVYVEWTKPEADYQNDLKVNNIDTSEPIRRRNGLRRVVRHARSTPPLLPRTIAQTEDFILRLWNFYARNNLKIEWWTFVILVICGLTKVKIFSLTGRITSATIHIALEAATETLVSVDYWTTSILSVTGTLPEHLQYLRANIPSFLARVQNAMGYKWHEFSAAVNNAIPRPNTTEIEQVIRDDGSSSAFSALDHARGGWTHMTGGAKDNLSGLMSAITATAAAVTSTTGPATIVGPPTATSGPSTTALGKRVIDLLWNNPPEPTWPTEGQTIVPPTYTARTRTTEANDGSVQSLKDKVFPTIAQSDMRAQLGNLEGTPVVTPTSTATVTAYTRANTNNEAGPWWLPSWLNGHHNDNTPQASQTATEGPDLTVNVDVEENDAEPTFNIEFNEQLKEPFPMLNRAEKSSAMSKLGDKISSAIETVSPRPPAVPIDTIMSSISEVAETAPLLTIESSKPTTGMDERFRTAYSMLNHGKHSVASKLSKKYPSATSKVAEEVSSATDAVESKSTMHIDDKLRTAYSMLNAPKNSVTSKVGKKFSKASSKASKEFSRASSKVSSKVSSNATSKPTLTATTIESKIDEKFDEMARAAGGRTNINEHGKRMRDGDDGRMNYNAHGKRVRDDRDGDGNVRTITVRPPGETLVLEVPRQDARDVEWEREEGRRWWFGRIPH